MMVAKGSRPNRFAIFPLSVQLLSVPAYAPPPREALLPVSRQTSITGVVSEQ